MKLIDRWNEYWEKIDWRDFLKIVLIVFLGASAIGLAINITLTLLSYGRW